MTSEPYMVGCQPLHTIGFATILKGHSYSNSISIRVERNYSLETTFHDIWTSWNLGLGILDFVT